MAGLISRSSMPRRCRNSAAARTVSTRTRSPDAIVRTGFAAGSKYPHVIVDGPARSVCVCGVCATVGAPHASSPATIAVAVRMSVLPLGRSDALHPEQDVNLAAMVRFFLDDAPQEPLDWKHVPKREDLFIEIFTLQTRVRDLRSLVNVVHELQAVVQRRVFRRRKDAALQDRL